MCLHLRIFLAAYFLIRNVFWGKAWNVSQWIVERERERVPILAGFMVASVFSLGLGF
jgi:hypothetical protein